MSELVSIHRIKKPDLLAQASRRLVAMPTPERPLIVSASELRDFMRCRVKHHWRHQCRLEPEGGAENLQMGDLIHKICEAWYQLAPQARTRKAMKRLAKKMVGNARYSALNQEHYDLIEAMLIGFSYWALDINNDMNDACIGLIKCVPEKWFDLKLSTDGSIRVRGKIDMFFESAILRKTLAGFENKSRGQFRDENLEQTLQLSVYLWAMREIARIEMKKKFKRYIMFYQRMRKQMPGPRVTAPLFDRQEIERDDDELEAWRVDACNAALDMHGGAIYASPMEDCAWSCDFKTPCLLRGKPEDLKHVLTSAFKLKEKRV